MANERNADNPIILSPVIEPSDHSAPTSTDLTPPCSACGSPRDALTRFCVACGSPQEVPDQRVAAGHPKTADESADSHVFQCENCGSQVATTQDQRSYHCPFCDSKYVVELANNSDRYRPEFIIGFSVTREQAQEKYYQWLGKNSFLRPGDLAQKAVTEKQRGVYLPFWHFAMNARSRWRSRIGQYWYRTETYTVRNSEGKTERRTRQVRETEWWPLNGEHEKYYYGFLISASRGLPQKESRGIQPYNLKKLARYRPFYLAGWLSEEYRMEQPEAISLCKQEFYQREERAIAGFLPGDTYGNLQVQTEFEVISSDLVLLPVHVLSYRYGERTFRFLVNGQTGKICGEKPWSSSRITLLVIAIIVVIAIISVLIFFGIQSANANANEFMHR